MPDVQGSMVKVQDSTPVRLSLANKMQSGFTDHSDYFLSDVLSQELGSNGPDHNLVLPTVNENSPDF